MQQVTVDAARWQQDSDGAWLCLRVQSPRAAMAVCDELQPDKQYVAQIKRKGRSLDANAYFWVLVGKLSDKLQISPRAYIGSISRTSGAIMRLSPSGRIGSMLGIVCGAAGILAA